MASFYSVDTQRKMFNECVHGVALRDSCAKCASEERKERVRKDIERKVRSTRFGNLCGLK